MKRILCLLLSCVCVFFTGCNSIIYKGNLKIKTFEPETLPNVSNVITSGTREQEKKSLERFNVEGTDAFFILPGHDTDTESILEFEVLDYVDGVGFIYAYISPYISDKSSDTGLIVSASGNARSYIEQRKAEEKKKQEEGLENTEEEKKPTPTTSATVLMSYNPKTMDYKVFKCVLNSITVKKGEGDNPDVVEYEDLMTHKLVGKHEYFLFLNRVAYVFNSSGTEVYYFDASALITQEVERISAEYGDGEAMDVTMADVVMDSKHYLYIPLLMQKKGSGDSADDVDKMDDDEFEEQMFSRILVCYNLDISGGDPEFTFVSYNQNWEKQKALWLEYDTSNREASGSLVFEDEDALEKYQKKHTLKKIKEGDVEKGAADNFSVFRTESSNFPLELVGFPDSSDMELKLTRDGEGMNDASISSPVQEVADVMLNYLEYKRKSGTSSFGYDIYLEQQINDAYKDMENGGDPDEYQRKMEEQYQEILHMQAASALLLASMKEVGFQSYFPRLMDLMFTIWEEHVDDCYLVIPGIAPGEYDEDDDTNEWEIEDDEREILFARRINDGQEKTGSQYMIIRIPGRFGANGDNCVPTMVSYQGRDKLKRRLAYKEEVEDDDGNEWEEIRYVEEESESVQNSYKVVFPKGTNLSWIEVKDTKEMVAPGESMGAIYYVDEKTDDYDSESSCKISYMTGGGETLSDSGINGKAMDAAILTGKGRKALVFVTSTGVKIYPAKENESIKKDRGHYVKNEELFQADDFVVSDTKLDIETGEDVSEQEKKKIEDALNKGTTSESLEAGAFTIIGDDTFLVSMLGSGLVYYKASTEKMSYQFMDGSYYRTFPVSDSKDDSRYVTVGFKTDEYTYSDSDISRAKFYEVDTKRIESELYFESVKKYLDDTLAYVQANRYKENKTDSDKQKDQLINNLYYKEESDMTEALNSLVKRLKLGTPTKELQDYVRETRTLLQDQKEGISRFYKLASVVRPQNSSDEKLYRTIEESLMNAYTPTDIERNLVEVRLLDSSIAQIGDSAKRERYEGYHEEYLEYAAAQAGQTSQGGQHVKLTAEQLSELMLKDFQQSQDSKTQVYQQGIISRGFYQRVLEDLKEEYQESVKNDPDAPDWNGYLKKLLPMVTAGEAKDQATEAVELFCSLLQSEPEEGLEERIRKCRTVLDAEELVVECYIAKAGITASAYKEAWNAYLNDPKETKEEQRAAFEAGTFYQIIKDIKQENEPVFEKNKTDWEHILITIVRNCGGIITE